MAYKFNLKKQYVLISILFLAAATFAFFHFSTKEKTFAIIKPEAVSQGNTDAIIAHIKKNGFTIIAQEKIHMSREKAEEFYAVHKNKPFYQELINSISSAPVVLLVLEKKGAIKAWRKLMGATDPAKAKKGTIRKIYGTSITNNAVHGSDSPETACYEIGLFFPDIITTKK